MPEVRAFIDTNVIVDVIAKREPFFADSQAVLALCALGELEGMVSDLTFCNVAYVMRKQLGNAQLRAGLCALKGFLTIVPVGERAITSALANELADFEDAVQLESALAAGAETIVTRNKRHFEGAPIQIRTPTEILAL